MKKTIKAFSARAAMMLLATLLLTMTAQTAWADDPLPAADGNGNVTISTPGTYTASGHIYGNLIINTSGEVILNVDNLTLDRDDDSSNYDGEILLENGTLTLNISNDKILKARKVMATTLAMTGGTISADNVDANTINMSAGLIEAYNFDAGGTISGGRITVQNFTAGYNTYQDFITLTISGGTITVNGTFYIYDLEINASTPGLSITANTYDISSWHSVLSITGGNVTDGTNTYNSDHDSVESLKGYLASNSNVTLTVAGSTPANNTYTVTFNANGGTGDAMSAQTFTVGETKALSSCTYTREGYAFDGWAIAANGDKVYDNGASVSNLVSAGESFTLYAHWTANTYTVRFAANGGDGGDQMADQVFTYDAAQDLTACTYTRTGYTFAGWATTHEGDVAYTNGQNVNNLTTTADATVEFFAKWTPISYTVTFNANGGQGDQMPNQAFTYDAAQKLNPLGYSRNGYTFAGWAMTPDGDVAYTNEENVNNLTTTAGATVEFFAKWTPITYTVNFNANGGDGDQMADQAFTYDAAQNLTVCTYTRTGYTFAGWATTAEGDVEYTNGQSVRKLTTTADATVEFFAKWTPITYTVTFNANGGQGDQMPNQAFTYDAAQNLNPLGYSRNGYTFAGWAMTPDGDVAYTNEENVNNLTTTADATVEFFAKWTPITYTVTFNANGGDGGDQMADQAFTYDAAQNLRDCSYTLTGYTFAGWVMTPDGDVAYTNGQNVNNLTTTADATVMLFAKWTPISYTVTFDRNGGDGGDQMADQAFIYDAAQDLTASIYTRTGYTFAGWATTAEGDVAYTNGQNVNNLTTTADATVMLFAKWTPISYTVRFAANGGDGGDQMADQAFTYDAAQDLTACTYTRTGYTFAGWATTHEGDVEYTNEENVNNLTTTAGATVEFFAKWTPITYTVTFNANGGQGDQMPNQAFTYDAAQNLNPLGYSRNGYTFAGWAMTPDGDVAYTNEENVNNLTTTADETVEFFAKWTPISYTVTFNANGGDGGDQMADQAFTYDEAQNLRDCSYTLTGYTFAGWAMTPDGDVAYTNGQNVNNLTTTAGATVMLFAKWTPISYTVTFDRNGGDGGDQMADQAFIYDAAQDLTACTYTRTGYTFAGWATTHEGDVEYTNEENVNNLTTTADETVEFFAKWTPISYTVTFDRNGGDGGDQMADQAFTYDEAQNLRDCSYTLTGYTFAGWAMTPDGDVEYTNGQNVNNLTTTADATVMLFAKWTAKNYTVTLDRQDGEVDTESVTATYDADMPAITPPTMLGYTFGGYYTETDGGGTQYYNADGTSTRPWNIDEATTLYAKWEIVRIEIDGITYEWKSETNTFKVAGCNSTLQSLVIRPSVEYNDELYNVTEIGERAFEGNTSLVTIEMTNCPITVIGKQAFMNCENLSEIRSVPPSLENIEEEAFRGSGLREFTIPEGVTSIYDYAFADCSRLTSVTIPASVTYVAENAFEGCNGNFIIYVPEGLVDDYRYRCPDLNIQAIGTIPYIAADGSQAYCTDYTVLDGSETSLGAGWYVVNSDIYYTGTITLTGDVNIILGNGMTMTVNTTGNGIDGKDYTNPGDLTIYGQTVQGGTLSVTASGEISEGICCQNFTVNSGAVNATGVYNGINAENGAITINNGYVNATSSYSGYGSSCISASLGITISGGTVEAHSKSDGISSYIGDIIISGGNVTVECTDYSSTRGIYNDSGNITISGGTVEVTSENLGIYADGGGITISGGTIDANGKNTCIFAYSEIVISGGSVDATGGSCGISNCEGNITISGGSVTADGGDGINLIDGNVYLGWSNARDRITVSSFVLGGNIFIADGQSFYNGEIIIPTGKVNDRSNLEGKTLEPYGMTLAAKQVTVDERTDYWTTFYCGGAGFSFDDGENVCAYTATVSGTEITLHKLGRVIPQGTAVIIVGEDESIDLTISSATVANMPQNHLHGVDAATPLDDVKTSYGADAILVLANKNKGLGFYELATTNVPARKAFLAIDDPDPDPNAGARQFTMVFDDATGIHSIDNGQLIMDNEAGAWYSLDGRRLTGKPTQKGLYIHNGNKVLVK